MHLFVQGQHLQRGSRQVDFHISLGDAACVPVSLTDNQADCRPPKNRPRKTIRDNFCHGDKLSLQASNRNAVYGLEACSLRKSQFESIDFAINSAFRKIFNIKSQDVVDVCRDTCGCSSAELTIAKRKRKFLLKFSVCENQLCCALVDKAMRELSCLSRLFNLFIS